MRSLAVSLHAYYNIYLCMTCTQNYYN